MVTAEIIEVITNSPAKHCQLDPAPTWVVKKLLPVLADVIAMMCNESFAEGTVPSDLNSAFMCPRLKKSILDTDDITSYHPISNLSFISKTLEWLVAKRFMGMPKDTTCCQIVSQHIILTILPQQLSSCDQFSSVVLHYSICQ